MTTETEPSAKRKTIAASRSDWLLHLVKMETRDKLRIFPLDGLTTEEAEKALIAARPKDARAFRIIKHGSVMYVSCWPGYCHAD